MITRIIEGLGLTSFVFGIGCICGAIENGTSWKLPLVLVVIGWVILFVFGNYEDYKEDCNDCTSDSRPKFLH